MTDLRRSGAVRERFTFLTCGSVLRPRCSTCVAGEVGVGGVMDTEILVLTTARSEKVETLGEGEQKEDARLRIGTSSSLSTLRLISVLTATETRFRRDGLCLNMREKEGISKGRSKG